MTDRVSALSEQFHMLPSGVVVLCAVSGGADSMCLLHLLHTMSRQMKFSIQCAHFNHKLRGAEADRDEAFVRDWCQKRGIPFLSASADVLAESQRSGQGIEEAARRLRYAFLEKAAKEIGAERIATAHTADDNAETLLLHLTRGTGLQGLGGIPPRRGNVIRPLLNVSRAQVEEYCAEHGVPYVEDSTNADDTYTRNFLRHQVIPLLKQVNPRAAEHMSAAAQKAREDHKYLDELAAEVVACATKTKQGLEIEVDRLAQTPVPVAIRGVRILMERAGGGKNCTAAHVDAVMQLCRSRSPSAKAQLPGLRVRREYEKLVFELCGEGENPPEPVSLDMDGTTDYGETGWSATCRKLICPATEERVENALYISCSRLCGGLMLRQRRTGDEIKLPGRGTKSVKKLFVDEKVPLSQREYIPVLADDAGVLAVGGFGIDINRMAQPGEEAIEVLLQKE